MPRAKTYTIQADSPVPKPELQTPWLVKGKPHVSRAGYKLLLERLVRAACKVTCDECGWKIGDKKATNKTCPDCAPLRAVIGEISRVT